MPDANGLVETLKRAAVEAVEAKKPVNMCVGKVMEVSPLKVSVEQKMILGEKQLILSRNVTDFKTEVTINWITENGLGVHSHAVKGRDSGGDSFDLTTGSEDLKHTHEIAGRKEITVHNGLAVGDEVILIRQQGGQKYFVWDRIGR